jgi:GT2 family glycosyltransferase
VVLNYRTPEQTWLAVRSLQTSLTRPSAVIVVDNGSGDGSVDAFRSTLEGVEILETGANLGFSGGSNAGIRRALERGMDFVLLVNSDAVLAPDMLDRLLDAASADPGAGILAPVLLSREEPDHIASAGIVFSFRTGRMRHRGAGLPLSLLPPAAVMPVDAVSGCVMLIRREVFEQAGLLDDDYFFSFEDIDFCLRARAAGFGVACVQDALAYHEGGRTIGRRSSRRVYFATRNHLRLARAVCGPGGHRLRAAGIVALNLAYVLVAPEAPLVGGLAAVARGAWHHVTGHYGAD